MSENNSTNDLGVLIIKFFEKTERETQINFRRDSLKQFIDIVADERVSEIGGDSRS